MDADSAPAPGSRWKKPSSGPHPRKGDAAADAHPGPDPTTAGPPPPSSRSELKRREAAALALAAAEAARGSDASFRVDGGHGAVQRLWSDADELAAFHERTDRVQRGQDAGPLFDSIRDSISPHTDVVLSPEDDDPDGQEAGEQDADERRRVVVAGEMDAEKRRLVIERTLKPAPAPRRDSVMPSKRPFASAMDADAAPAPPSPSSSKKRSFSPQPRIGDDHQGPNPSPCGSPSRRSELKRWLRTSAETAALALAVVAAEAARWSDGSVRVDGGYDADQSLEPAGVPVNVGHGAVQRLEHAGDEGCGAAPKYPKTWRLLPPSASALAEHRAIGTRGCCSAPSGALFPPTSTRPRCPTSWGASGACTARGAGGIRHHARPPRA
ncbi:uncharacterized protein LOC133921132 [Phragmites australis]|uniref:uncharacterized protein LOC133921132 n=1 Tax=Phragmites australis TaxID=29695 RepID=UPI002D797018|nr:uncharacterized protein LOC133921132 [Phragmites australis]